VRGIITIVGGPDTRYPGAKRKAIAAGGVRSHETPGNSDLRPPPSDLRLKVPEQAHSFFRCGNPLGFEFLAQLAQ